MDVAKCTSLPITIVFLPASDIATYVGEGNVDIGITGLDVVKESQETDVEQILVLNNCDKIIFVYSLSYLFYDRNWDLENANYVFKRRP